MSNERNCCGGKSDLIGLTCPHCDGHFHVAEYVWYRFRIHRCGHCGRNSQRHELQARTPALPEETD